MTGHFIASREDNTETREMKSDKDMSLALNAHKGEAEKVHASNLRPLSQSFR